MGAKMDWTNRIGRRVKLRDLHIFLAVVQFGSMARAAKHLAVSQPVLSKTIANLEHALGVRLLDRSSQGVEPTAYGRAFLNCGTAVFDELRALNPDVVVVLSSGFAEQTKIASMLGQGLRGFIPKPYSRSKLLEQVRSTLEAGRQATR